MRRQLFIVALLGLGVVGGCKVDQQAEVRTYRSVVDLPATRPADITITQITLLQALQRANQQNERLSIEGENYLQATINRKLAVATFLPTVNLTGAYGLGENVGASGKPNHSLDVAAVGSMNLFNGFRDVASLRVADLTIQQRKYLLLDVQESLLTDVVRAYHEVLRNEQLVAVLENTLRLQDQRVTDIRGRQQAGVARPLDVAQTEAQAANTRVLLIRARSAVTNARIALGFLTAMPLEHVALIDADPLDGDVPQTAAAVESALKERDDLLAAGKARDAARQNVEVAVGQYYPSVSANLTGFLYRESTPSDRDWLTLLQVNLPVFSAGKIEAQVRLAWSEYRQAALFDSLLRRQVSSDVQVACEDVRATDQRLAELTIQVSAAEQAVTQAEQSYNVGLATNLERLTAQDQLLNARLQYAAEYYNRRVAYADLLHAMGKMRVRVEQEMTSATGPATRPATGPASQTAIEVPSLR